jgi:hypothetical protein
LEAAMAAASVTRTISITRTRSSSWLAAVMVFPVAAVIMNLPSRLETGAAVVETRIEASLNGHGRCGGAGHDG